MCLAFDDLEGKWRYLGQPLDRERSSFFGLQAHAPENGKISVQIRASPLAPRAGS